MHCCLRQNWRHRCRPRRHPVLQQCPTRLCQPPCLRRVQGPLICPLTEYSVTMPIGRAVLPLVAGATATENTVRSPSENDGLPRFKLMFAAFVPFVPLVMISCDEC